LIEIRQAAQAVASFAAESSECGHAHKLTDTARTPALPASSGVWREEWPPVASQREIMKYGDETAARFDNSRCAQRVSAGSLPVAAVGAAPGGYEPDHTRTGPVPGIID